MKLKLLSVALFCLSILPFWVLYRLSDLIYYVLFYGISYRKEVVLTNLEHSFPERTEKERLQIAKKFYRFLPDVIVEAIKMRTISDKEVIKRFRLINPEEVYRHLHAGKSVIGVTAHFGNWELAIHRLSLMVKEPVLIIYKPLSNKKIDALYNAVRSRFGARMIPMEQILRTIVRLKDQPHVSIFAADQAPVYRNSDYFLTFLNQETLVYTGAERIARLTKNPVVFSQVGREKKRGHYYCRFTTIVENPEAVPAENEITKRHNKLTEEMIRANPEYWLWTHKRWKRKRRT